MKKALSFLMVTIFIFMAVGTTVNAEDGLSHEYVCGTQLDTGDFVDKDRNLVYFINDRTFNVEEDENFFESFIKNYVNPDLTFDNIFLDNSYSMTHTFKKQTKSIINNLPHEFSKEIENMFKEDSSETELTYKISEILQQTDTLSFIVISDLWDTNFVDFSSVIPKENFSEYPITLTFFVPYYSTDIAGIRHCEDYALKLVKNWPIENNLYIVYLDNVIMTYYGSAYYDDNTNYFGTRAYRPLYN